MSIEEKQSFPTYQDSNSYEYPENSEFPLEYDKTYYWRVVSKDINGNIIGVHEGIINFTIGQRKGIKIADKKPLYVVAIDPEKNEITVGSKDKLIKKEIYLKNINLLCSQDEFNKEIFVKVRSTGKLLKSKVKFDDDNTLVSLLEDEYGISPGQACVFYSKNNFGYKVLGGGWIK